MSKSIIIRENGGPEVIEITEAKIKLLGPNEIKIKNLAIGLNFIDTYHRSGLYPIDLPSGLGLEASGKVLEVGKEVKNLKVGDNIAYAGGPIGAYSEMRIIPAAIAVKLPEEIPHKIAATIMTKGLTSFYLLFKTYKPKKNEWILFHAAAGGVGQIFTQWAKSIGCNVIGTVGSADKIEIAKRNGCDHVINYTEKNFSNEVKEITDGKGVAAVYDGVGKKTLPGSTDCLRPRGMMISFGNASGPLDPLDVPKYIQGKSLFFTRPTMKDYFSTREELDEASKALFKEIISKKINIKIFKEYKLEEARKSHEDLEARKITGPSILIP